MTPEEEMRQLYARLPSIDCQGKCWHSCAADIPCSPLEMRMAMGPIRLEPPKAQGPHCPYLDINTKRCTVHPNRPLICRLWGVVEDLRCKHGCKPKPRYLTRPEAAALIKESIRIGNR